MLDEPDIAAMPPAPADRSPMVSEAQRADILAAHGLDDLEDDPELVALTGFAAALCDAPTALVSLVEDERQRFLAREGLLARETPRAMSFCATAMLGAEIMEVGDASHDPRFADNALVTGAPFIRFYAGAPLLSEEGVPLGALCVIAPQPRAGLTPLQRQGLTVLAAAVVRRLRTHRAAIAHRVAGSIAAQAISASAERFRVLADTMPQMVWSTLPDGFHDYYNARWYEFTGVPVGSTDGEGWNDIFHPEDQERAWEVWRRSLATGEPYEIEYRLRRHDGQYRWTLGRALPMRDETGAIVRWFGTCTDIHDNRTLSESRELLSQELSHRIKNIFSVMAGLIQLSTRARPELRDVAATLADRIAALGRAHEYVRPHDQRRADSLKGMLGELFAPYGHGGDERVTLGGDDLAIRDDAATPLALLFHELATNAAKYGALSAEGGRVTLDIARRADDVVLVWRERGGPPVAAGGAAGFGSSLITLSVERQLGGAIERRWEPAGLVATISIPLDAIAR